MGGGQRRICGRFLPVSLPQAARPAANPVIEADFDEEVHTSAFADSTARLALGNLRSDVFLRA